MGPNSTSRCTLGCINNSSNNRPFTLTMCLRLDSRRTSISMSFHALSFQGGNMSPRNTMQYHLLPGGGGAPPAAFQPHPRENAHADDKKSSNVNDNADHICWTCHKELVCLKKNICAGCFKVCHYILFFIQNDQLNIAGSLL